MTYFWFWPTKILTTTKIGKLAPLVEGWPTKAKKSPSPHKVRLVAGHQPGISMSRGNLFELFIQILTDMDFSLQQTHLTYQGVN